MPGQIGDNKSSKATGTPILEFMQINDRLCDYVIGKE